MNTGPLNLPRPTSPRTHCGHAMEQRGNRQVALRIQTEETARGIVLVILCERCLPEFDDVALHNYREIQDWLERGMIPKTAIVMLHKIKVVVEIK